LEINTILMKIKFNFSINLSNIKEYKEAVNFF
jgi:hypothetical protein